MPQEYIIYEREIQEVQNRLQDIHDYNETTEHKWGWKTSRETHYRSWHITTKSTGKRNVNHPIKTFLWNILH